MKTKTSIISLILILFTLVAIGQENSIEDANNMVEKFKKKDPGIKRFFDSAYGYAIFPSIGKGGFVVGGAGGKGTVYREGTPVADVKMSQITVGAQVGGQKYSEVIFFEDELTYKDFVSGTFEFAAQISAVALSEGVSQDADYKNGVVVFTLPIGGLMAEVSAGGQKFKVTPY